MAACVLVAKNLTLPMSVIARLVSKAPTVRRGWTGVACSHVRTVRWGSQSGQRWGEGGRYRAGEGIGVGSLHGSDGVGILPLCGPKSSGPDPPPSI